MRYLRANPDVTDVLLHRGDPMIMRTGVIERYIDALLVPDLERIDIRIGTKAPAYWPQRFTTDDDADDLLRMFERVVAAGRHLAVMAHYSHPRELETDEAQEAVRRIRSTGAEVRCQAPLIRHVNDSADAWAEMIRAEVRVGAVPYYMFVERDTGARRYFELPLERAFEIYTGAVRQVSGLARTIRGPVMSATPGQGPGRRHRRARRREGVRAEAAPGPRTRVGQPALLRQVRPGSRLVRRARARLRRTLVLRESPGKGNLSRRGPPAQGASLRSASGGRDGKATPASEPIPRRSGPNV